MFVGGYARHLASAVMMMIALPLCAQDEVEAERFSYRGDWLLRAESTDVPGREQIERLRSRLRLGVEFIASDALLFGASARLALGSDDNRDNRRNLDNQRSDEIAVDQLWMRWQVNPDWVLVAGKDQIPLGLSPMLWDDDLRPIGVSSDWRVSVADFDSVSVVVGYFAPDFLYENQSRLAAAQIGYRYHEGAPQSATVLLSYLHYSDLQELPGEGLARTNRVSAGQLLSDYRLLDLQLIGRTEIADWPLELRLDLVKNLAADDLNEGGRVSLVLGDRRQAGRWEFGLAAQRMQRDAVLAAASEDDWWFHSFARGVMPWLGYGLSDVWNVRLAAFDERRDLASVDVRRYLFDLQARW